MLTKFGRLLLCVGADLAFDTGHGVALAHARMAIARVPVQFETQRPKI